MTDDKRKQADSREGMIVTTIALRRDVHRHLSIVAIEDHTVMTELVRQAVDEWLARRGRKGPVTKAGTRKK
jgi:hypothetical protein